MLSYIVFTVLKVAMDASYLKIAVLFLLTCSSSISKANQKQSIEILFEDIAEIKGMLKAHQKQIDGMQPQKQDHANQNGHIHSQQQLVSHELQNKQFVETRHVPEDTGETRNTIKEYNNMK